MGMDQHKETELLWWDQRKETLVESNGDSSIIESEEGKQISRNDPRGRIKALGVQKWKQSSRKRTRCAHRREEPNHFHLLRGWCGRPGTGTGPSTRPGRCWPREREAPPTLHAVSIMKRLLWGYWKISQFSSTSRAAKLQKEQRTFTFLVYSHVEKRDWTANQIMLQWRLLVQVHK